MAVIAFVRARPILAHLVLSVLIVTLVVAIGAVAAIRDPASASALGQAAMRIYEGPRHINMVTLGGEALRAPMLWLIFLFAGAPTLAAFALAALGAGQSISALLQKFLPFGATGLKARALIMYGALFAVYALGFVIFDWAAGPGVDVFFQIEGWGLGLLGGAALALFLDEGGTLEELGWRGFLWPLLQDRLGAPLLAALVLGILHWAWHLPREAAQLAQGFSAAWLIGQSVFLVLCVALAIVAGYCVNLAGGSVWPAIFIHGGTNVWSKALSHHVGPSFGVLDLRTLILIALAVLVALFAGRRLGRA